MSKINTPYVSTIIIDYCWMASMVLVFYVLAADRNSAVSAGLAMLYLPLMNTIREQIYWILHKSSFSDFKTKWKLSDHTDYFLDIAVTVTLVVGGTAGMAYYGLIDYSFFSITEDDHDSGSILKSLMVVSRDYWMINILKDNITMRYAHQWMHKKENYWLHKRHHQANRNSNIWHAFVFDVIDLFLEFLCGGLLALTANKLLFGTAQIHLLSLMFCLWTDGNVHSENPYSQCIGNPILDYFFKLNICHNLHHAAESEQKYMVVLAYHHVSTKERDYDITQYNKRMKTNVDFRLFLD